MATTQDKLHSTTSHAAIFAVQDGEVLIPAPQLASELGINRRTLARWWDDPALGFPKPTRINIPPRPSSTSRPPRRRSRR